MSAGVLDMSVVIGLEPVDPDELPDELPHKLSDDQAISSIVTDTSRSAH